MIELHTTFQNVNDRLIMFAKVGINGTSFHTVCKIKIFPITQILREIIIWDSKSAIQPF